MQRLILAVGVWGALLTHSFAACVPLDGSSLFMDTSQCVQFSGTGCLMPVRRAYAAESCQALYDYISRVGMPSSYPTTTQYPAGRQAQSDAFGPSSSQLPPLPSSPTTQKQAGGMGSGGWFIAVPLAVIGGAGIAVGLSRSDSGSSSSTR